ncbi:MAG: hypothetical protein D6706_01880 [Chloroflexi bacterium]|nr:MAG: hypothetical protein D6706_01880 [Chloroflexota bacterium]
MNKNGRSPLHNILLLLLGLLVGSGLGLYIGWVAWPTEFTNADPTLLDESYRRDIVLMTASVYAADGNLIIARQRIASLGENGEEFLLAVLVDEILRAENETTIRQLVNLAADLGLSSPAMAPYLAPTPERVP